MVIISVILMAVDHRQQHLDTIRSALSVVIYPIQYLVNLPVSAGSWVNENLSSREALLAENTRLKMQQTLYKAQLQKFSAIELENQRLRELLQSSPKAGEHVLIGELMAVDLEPFTRQVMLNKGMRHQVYLGQPLVDAQGVMGQIVHLGPFSSVAMLITDANHAIPVQVNRNGLRAIAFGTGAPDTLSIPFLPNSADIVVGDLLISSGLDGRFPPDYPVAIVSDIQQDPTQPYAVINAKTTAQLEQAREVLLVWPSPENPEASAPADTTSADAPAAPAEATP